MNCAFGTLIESFPWADFDVRAERDHLVLNSDLCRNKTKYKNWYPALFYENVNIVMKTTLFKSVNVKHHFKLRMMFGFLKINCWTFYYKRIYTSSVASIHWIPNVELMFDFKLKCIKYILREIISIFSMKQQNCV